MGNCADDVGFVGEPLPADSANLQKNSVEQLERAVDCLFRKYDKDKNGYLDKREVCTIINAALSEISGGRKANKSEVNSLI